MLRTLEAGRETRPQHTHLLFAHLLLLLLTGVQCVWRELLGMCSVCASA